MVVLERGLVLWIVLGNSRFRATWVEAFSSGVLVVLFLAKVDWVVVNVKELLLFHRRWCFFRWEELILIMLLLLHEVIVRFAFQLLRENWHTWTLVSNVA